MSSHKTFPKEGTKKLKETIRDLRALIKQKEKEIKFLMNELENIVKPTRERRGEVERPKPGSDAWRKDFVRRFKREVLGTEE